MSFDVYLRGRHGETIQFDESHDIKGGTYAVGGTNEAWLNITYNYAPILRRVMGMPLRNLEGMRAGDTLTLLRFAISQLGDDLDSDYWKPTEGNVKQALQGLLALAEAAPHGVWHVT